ncbi:MAG: glycosyltransferase family 2 protein, partial [Patescibacteria group bacterium]
MAGRKRSLKPKTSLVVVSYNGYEVTKKCLDSIFRNSGDSSLYEVILVDNASTDESKSRLITRYANRSNFSCVSLNSNTFLTAAYNAGFMKSRADVLVFMNNDTTMTPQWLDKILSKFESKSVGIVGVSLLSGKSPDYIDSQGCSLNVLGYGFRINSGKKYSQKLEMEEPFFIAGSVLAVRRNLFQKTGMFDEAYDGNYEDVDLAWRIRLLGYSIEVAYDAIVYHYGSWSVAKFFDAHHSSYLCRKNRLMTLLKNG